MKPPVEAPTSRQTRAGRDQAEMSQRMLELDAAAGNPGMVLAAHLQRRVGGERLAGLVDPPFAGEHLAGEDQRLRAGAALGQAALDEQLIGANRFASAPFRGERAPDALRSDARRDALSHQLEQAQRQSRIRSFDPQRPERGGDDVLRREAGVGDLLRLGCRGR